SLLQFHRRLFAARFAHERGFSSAVNVSSSCFSASRRYLHVWLVRPLPSPRGLWPAPLTGMGSMFADEMKKSSMNRSDWLRRCRVRCPIREHGENFGHDITKELASDFLAEQLGQGGGDRVPQQSRSYPD